MNCRTACLLRGSSLHLIFFIVADKLLHFPCRTAFTVKLCYTYSGGIRFFEISKSMQHCFEKVQVGWVLFNELLNPLRDSLAASIGIINDNICFNGSLERIACLF